ncbi:MAG: carbohydrate ABC transporter permease [Clostridiaceae bacterium]|nr:carbohydrate ABC transporter permease [Clostridiaceae bacterium]
MHNRSKIRLYSSTSDKIYMVFVYIITLLIIGVVLIPLIFVVASSFSSADAVMAGKVYLWPVGFTLKGYAMILSHEMLLTGIRNSILYVVLGTTINIIMTILAAYPLSRKDLKLRNPIMFMFSFTMLFSGGMIPVYLLVRNLGLLDTIWAMVIPSAMSIWNVIVMRTYFQISIPQELLESSALDGCDDFRFLLKIALPLSVPIIAVNILLYAVGHWNSYMGGFLYLTNSKLYPLQLVLRDILITSNITGVDLDIGTLLEREKLKALLQYSTIVVASVPVMLLYPLVQKYFVKGVMIGAIKG